MMTADAIAQTITAERFSSDSWGRTLPLVGVNHPYPAASFAGGFVF